MSTDVCKQSVNNQCSFFVQKHFTVTERKGVIHGGGK